jgi:hypothetical protein
MMAGMASHAPGEWLNRDRCTTRQRVASKGHDAYLAAFKQADTPSCADWRFQDAVMTA